MIHPAARGLQEQKGSTLKRSRGRGRRPQNHHQSNRTFDSSGPDIKIRGSAPSVYEKYLQLARDASSAGDRVAAENYLQHAEHYFRIMSAQNAQQAQQAQANQANGGGRAANGTGEQPFVGQSSGSGPSFSLHDGEETDETDEPAAS